VDELLDIIEDEDAVSSVEYRLRQAHRRTPQSAPQRTSQASSGGVSFELYQGGAAPDPKDEKD
jgi:hypothetical protein